MTNSIIFESESRCFSDRQTLSYMFKGVIQTVWAISIRQKHGKSLSQMMLYCFPPLKIVQQLYNDNFYSTINRRYYLYWCRIVYMRKSCSLKLCFLASLKHNLSNENICFRFDKSCHLIENCTSFLNQFCLKLLNGIKSLQFAKKLSFLIFWSLNSVWMKIFW